MTEAATVAHAWPERLSTKGAFLANGLGIGAWAASLPSLKSALALSAGALSLPLFAFAVGAVLAMLAAPRLAAHWGSGRVTLFSAYAFAASLLLPTLAGNLPALAGAAFVIGAANGVMDVAMNAHASGVERRWGAAIMSSFHAAFSAGGLLGAALGTLVGAGGARPILMSGAALAGALTLASAGALRGAPIAPTAPVTDGFVLPRGALAIAAGAFLCFLCEGAMADWSAVYLAAVAAAPPTLAPAGYAAFSAAMFFGRSAGDFAVRVFGRARVVGAGGAVAAAGLALAYAAPALAPASLGFALVGIGLSNVVPALFSAASGLGVSPATGVAIAATAGYAGLVAGPVAIGAVAEVAGLRNGIALLAALACAVALTGRALARR